MSETFGIGHNYGSNTPQTLAYVPLDALHILACPRVPVAKVRHLLPDRYLTYIAEKAKRECCKHPENHDIEAWFSKPSEQAKGVPDIYKFYCLTCEANGEAACHARFCVGGNHPVDPAKKDKRPFWEIR